MKQAIALGILNVLFLTVLTACGNSAESNHSQEEHIDNTAVSDLFTTDTAISDVTSDPVFGDYGRLIFPVDDWYYSGDTLGDLRLTYYSNIDPNETVEIVNYMKGHAALGDTIFYDIYTEEEKVADPEKEDTGLFFFKGNPGERFAVLSAGGAFALIYRPGAQTACEDLARAIQFIFEHTEELEVNTDGYSLWGGSAGARMAAWMLWELTRNSIPIRGFPMASG